MVITMRLPTRLAVVTAFGMLTLGIVLPARATFEPRLESSPGSGTFLAYYDTELGITWATDSQIGGHLVWQAAQDWAAALVLGGVTGWRIPNMDRNGDGTVVNCTGPVICLDNEHAYQSTINGVTTISPGPFQNLVIADYWSSTDAGSGLAWEYQYSSGAGGLQGIDNGLVQMNLVWAVHDGDVGADPVPVQAPALSPHALVMLALLLVIVGRARFARAS